MINPINREMPVAKNATISEVRAPYITRTNSSRPLSSAPNQNWWLGPLGSPNSFRVWLMKSWFGPWCTSLVAMNGAKIAMRMSRPRNTRLAMARRSRLK